MAPVLEVFREKSGNARLESGGQRLQWGQSNHPAKSWRNPMLSGTLDR